MPGIVCLITRRPRREAEPELLRMVEALRHESFYNAGTLVDEGLGIYAGWITRRHSFSDGMPVCNERGDAVLVFSGEDYPDPGTARRLKERGHTFEDRGPSYLVHLSEEDPAFPAGLNGRFHGLLTDGTLGTATLFNDRYGLHRLYYHEARESVYFSAEAKAILAVRPELRTLDPRSLGEFVACRAVWDNRTLFKGIDVLPPASAWVFRHGVIERKGTYFQPREWEEQTPLAAEAAYEGIREAFSRNLPRYFAGDERIAMSLTGGLDTRMIMAWQKAPAGSLPCYSFAGMFRGSQDVLIARRVAGACGQTHAVIPVGEEFVARFQHYAERTVYLTDGCADVSRAPDLYANEQAATIAPVRMTGNYGGEVLRRVRGFKPVTPAEELFCPDFLSQIQAATNTFANACSGHPLSFFLHRQAPWHHYGLLALEQTQLSLRSPYLDNDLVRTLYRAPDSMFANNDACLRLIADGNPYLRRIRTDRGLAGRRGRLLSALSRGLLEFTFKAEYASDYGMPQWLARLDHSLKLRVERMVLGRHKFSHFRVWYRDTLSDYVRSMLLDPRSLSRPYLLPGALEAMVGRHVKGDRNYTSEIHTVLTLELLHRIFLDAPPAGPGASRSLDR